MPKFKSPLSQIHFHHLTDVFADMEDEVDYEWFINSGMTWGDADYTLYRVERLRGVINEYDNKQENDGGELARKMIAALELYDDDDLIDMES